MVSAFIAGKMGDTDPSAFQDCLLGARVAHRGVKILALDLLLPSPHEVISW